MGLENLKLIYLHIFTSYLPMLREPEYYYRVTICSLILIKMNLKQPKGEPCKKIKNFWGVPVLKNLGEL
jgi:hypothetical protein